MKDAVIPFPQAPPPRDDEAEREILGAILNWSGPSYSRVRAIITREDFFRDAHRVIWSAIERAAHDDEEATHYSHVRHQLKKANEMDAAGGWSYVQDLAMKNPDCARIELYAERMKEASRQRALVKIGSQLAQRATSEHSEELTAELAESLRSVKPTANYEDLLVPWEKIAAEVARLWDSGGVEQGFSTGWPSVDQFYKVARGAWTLVTGVPGHGKTNWLDQLTLQLAKQHDWQIVMFSAENPSIARHSTSLIQKHIRMPFGKGPSERMSKADAERGLMLLSRHYRFIDPAREGITLDKVLAAANAYAEKRPVDVLVIDPWNELQHEQPEYMTETQYISTQLSKVRRWARKHRAHVFLVAHPKVPQKEKGSNKLAVPTPYDVSGSAHWRNKADYCICVYRDLSREDEDNKVSIYVQKVRLREMGKLGVAELKYEDVTGAYIDPVQPRLYRDRYDGGGE